MIDSIYIPSFFLLFSSILSAVLPDNKLSSRSLVVLSAITPLVFLTLALNPNFGIFLPMGLRLIYSPLDFFLCFYLIFLFVFSYIFFYKKEDKSASFFILLYICCFFAMFVTKDTGQKFAIFEIMIVFEIICLVLRSINHSKFNFFNFATIFLSFLSILLYSFFTYSTYIENPFGFSFAFLGIKDTVFSHEITKFFLSAFIILRFCLFPFSSFFLKSHKSLSVFTSSLLPFLQALSTLYFCYSTHSFGSFYFYELLPITILFLSFSIFNFSSIKELVLCSSFCSICIGLMLFIEIPLHGIIFIATSGFVHLFFLSFFFAIRDTSVTSSENKVKTIKNLLSSKFCFFLSKILTVIFGVFSIIGMPFTPNFDKIMSIFSLTNISNPLFFIAVITYLVSVFVSFFYKLVPLIFSNEFFGQEKCKDKIFLRILILSCISVCLCCFSSRFEIADIGLSFFAKPSFSEIICFLHFYTGLLFICCAFLDTKIFAPSTINVQFLFAYFFSYIIGIISIFISSFFSLLSSLFIFFFISYKRCVKRLGQGLQFTTYLGFSLFSALIFALFCFAIVIANSIDPLFVPR